MTDPIARPRVKRMVMFKHGVAYLERSGPAQGSFELSFHKDEMNDVLKSLAAWVAEGDARVSSIAFEKPEDPEAVLARRKLVLDPTHALMGLFAAFRGRRVRVDDASGTSLEGEVIGFEDVTEGEAWDRRVVLRTAGDRIALMPLQSVRGVSLLEAPAKDDLELLVDRTRAASAGESRIVKVALEGSASDLRIAYVVPAPVWRVTYRIARGTSATGAPETHLVAWGIVHNPADEDLDDVALTLTTGQPVSFVIDLYHPKNVRRVEVEESSRATSAAPTAYQQAMPMMPPAPASFGPPGGPPMGGGMPFGAPAPAAPPAPVRRSMAASMAVPAEDTADLADRGELFEYRVAAPVSIKRGGSAMVPLLARPLDAHKERIWRQGSPPSPDLVLTFANDTGAVLEEGAAVVYDDDVYAGEAMVPYRVRGAEVKLAFAKDLAVRCRRESVQERVVARIALGKQALIEEARWEEAIELSAESDHAEPIDVIFEIPKLHGRSFASEGPQPFESTSAHHRFRVSVAARTKATLKVREVWPERRSIAYDSVQLGQLEQWLAQRFLDARTASALGPIVAAWDRAKEADRRIAELEKTRAAHYEQQKQLTAQLGVLKEGGPEGELRLRYARELAQSQDEVNRLRSEIASLESQRRDARADAQQQLEALVATVR